MTPFPEDDYVPHAPLVETNMGAVVDGGLMYAEVNEMQKLRAVENVGSLRSASPHP